MSEKTLEEHKKTVKEPEKVDSGEERGKLGQLVTEVSSEIAKEEQEQNKGHIENSEQVATVVARVMAREFSGPIPSPEVLAEYDEISSGFADRIISMAERQSKHRQDIERAKTFAESRDSFLGVLFAFLLGMGCIVACVIMVMNVPSAAGVICGAILGVTGISAIVTSFLKNTRK